MPHLDVFVSSTLPNEEELLDPETYKQRLQQLSWAQDYLKQRDEELSILLHDLYQVAGHLKEIMGIVTEICEIADRLSTTWDESNFDDIPDIDPIFQRLSDIRDEQFKLKFRFE